MEWAQLCHLVDQRGSCVWTDVLELRVVAGGTWPADGAVIESVDPAVERRDDEAGYDERTCQRTDGRRPAVQPTSHRVTTAQQPPVRRQIYARPAGQVTDKFI